MMTDKTMTDVFCKDEHTWDDAKDPETYCLDCGLRPAQAKELKSLAGDSEMLYMMYEADETAFVELTMKIDEHPEDYGGACLCALDRSYGD